jgi:hypothetical protein
LSPIDNLSSRSNHTAQYPVVFKVRIGEDAFTVHVVNHRGNWSHTG